MIKKVAKEHIAAGTAKKSTISHMIDEKEEGEMDSNYPKVPLTQSEKNVIKGAERAARAEALEEAAGVADTDATNL